MVRAGSSSSSGGGSAGGGARRGRSRLRTCRRRLGASCPGVEKMSAGMKKVDCFSPMLCHCKVACTNSTISLMFGCKVRGMGGVLTAGELRVYSGLRADVQAVKLDDQGKFMLIRESKS